jgi:hypothetical protein
MNLRQAASANYGDYCSFINDKNDISNSTWIGKISTGKLLEFLTQLSLLTELKSLGALIKIDDSLRKTPHLFYLRNEIPLHYGSKAGHETSIDPISLAERFRVAFIPKASFIMNDRKYLLFREGNPIHLVKSVWDGREITTERPDFSVVPGEIEVEIRDELLFVTHKVENEYAKMTLIIKNSSILPVKEYTFSPQYSVNVSGIIECSVKKSKIHVDSQLDNYCKLYGSTIGDPQCLFINGGDIKSKYTTINVDLKNIIASLESSSFKAQLRAYLALISS